MELGKIDVFKPKKKKKLRHSAAGQEVTCAADQEKWSRRRTTPGRMLLDVTSLRPEAPFRNYGSPKGTKKPRNNHFKSLTAC